MNSFGLDCWTSFSSGSPGTGTVLWQAGGGTSSQIMSFTSGAANGYSLNIAWKAAEFTSSRSSKTSGSSSSTRGSVSSSNTSGSAASEENPSSHAGGPSKGSYIGLGVGLGAGLLLVLILIGACLLHRRTKARSSIVRVTGEESSIVGTFMGTGLPPAAAAAAEWNPRRWTRKLEIAAHPGIPQLWTAW